MWRAKVTLTGKKKYIVLCNKDARVNVNDDDGGEFTELMMVKATARA
jgi:hypothetical protein